VIRFSLPHQPPFLATPLATPLFLLAQQAAEILTSRKPWVIHIDHNVGTPSVLHLNQPPF
jgi:hypothetical protein